MQVTQTLSDGLKREFRVVVPADQLTGKLEVKLDDMRRRANIPGFRPGKVPMAHLRKLYGKSVMAEIVNDAVEESSKKVAVDHELKLAREPRITMPDDREEIEGVIAGTRDLSYLLSLEILPRVELRDFKTVALDRPVTEVSEDDLEQALKRLGDQNQPFAPVDAPAQDGDKLTIDYRGMIDGEAFQGGSAEDADIVLGSGQFIPGFEEQLIGAGAGEARTVDVTFPEGYPAAHLAGKAARFDVTVKTVARPGAVSLDDAFASTLGMESLDKLKTAIREQIRRDDAAQSRRRAKRRLLDALDKEYSFDLPTSLVDQEFEIIWRNLSADMERMGKTFADENSTEDEAKLEYRRIAERRVRLGLLLAEIGERNAIQVSEEEMQRALFERARQFPGQERRVIEFYQKNPGAMAELRAPLFEEKAVDFVLELANVTDVPVSREELYGEDDEPA